MQYVFVYSGGFTTTLVFLGATIVLVMWSARSGGNGAIAAAAAVASIIFTMYFYTVPFVRIALAHSVHIVNHFGTDC